MQAITTKYFGPTNVRGSRVKASAQRGSIILDWDDSLNSADNHKRAAETLARKFGWTGKWYGGGLPDGRGDCFVLAYPHATDMFEIEA